MFYDLSQAFDRVDHKKLLAKLRSYNTDPLLLRWVRNFLSDRKNCVEIEDVRSRWTRFRSGVPQGTILGPLLFMRTISSLNSIRYPRLLP